ncbi:MAG: bacteriohopanetetrol glucosamine biosynthesis glycosyltransferase HpnI [Acidobacteriota bacterium]|nr:bacteriohopanetetrol glucosamine biosynthesis glycosyltransferase HpnI [Acidobacteriota bacterium]
MPSIPLVVAAICALLALAGTAYFALSMWAASGFQREMKDKTRPRFAPPVSILRSLKGLDPHMYLAFRSHCLLDYGEYEVLFGVSDANEPALALVQKLQEEFPLLQLRVVQCPLVLGMNGKVSNLAQMLPQAKYEYIVINDSDILVSRDYLQRVVAPLVSPKVGMVTTLYRGLAGKTLGSRLEALGLNTDFAGGVLVARALEGIRFGLGATIATTKTVLREIGGLEPLVDYLGDDYELGARTAGAGYQVELADLVVETALPDYGFGDFWVHQLRWARNVRDRRPMQYIGLIVTFALAWAVFAVIAAPFARWTSAVLVLTTAVRFSAAVRLGRGVLGDPRLIRALWLLPMRDFIALAVWLVSFAGQEVEWRGERFRLRKGKLHRS